MSQRKDSAMDKLSKTAYFWPRTLNPEELDYGYNSLGCSSVLIGRMIHLRSKNEITTRFPGHIADKIDEYFGKRSDEPSVWQEPVIRPHVFQLSESTMFKGTIYVGSRSKPKVSHRVRFSSVEAKNAPEERKKISFRFMSFKGDCEVHDYQLFKTVPFSKRARNEKGDMIDNRIASDIPPPETKMVMCPHIVAAFFYLIEERGCESYGIDEHVDTIIRYEIGNILDKKIPFYELNRYLMEKTVLLQEFKAWERKRI